MILDASAVLAFLRNEPAAEEVEALLVANQGASLTALGVAEVVDRLIRLGNVDAEAAVLDLAQLSLADAESLDVSVAVAAGLLRARHYHRSRCAVSLADCVAAAVAKSRGVAVATSDPHLLDMCSAEQISVKVLPDTRGRRWAPADEA